MLPAYIIDELLKREKQKEQQRPQLSIWLPDPDYDYPEKIIENDDESEVDF